MKAFKVFSAVLAVYTVVAGWFLLSGCDKEDADTLWFEVIEHDLEDRYRGIVCDSSSLTSEVFDDCADEGKRVIERSISIVKNDAGDGMVFNTSDKDYDYISFKDLEVSPGDIIVTYLVYELGASCDEIEIRYDYSFLTGEKIK